MNFTRWLLLFVFEFNSKRREHTGMKASVLIIIFLVCACNTSDRKGGGVIHETKSFFWVEVTLEDFSNSKWQRDVQSQLKLTEESQEMSSVKWTQHRKGRNILRAYHSHISSFMLQGNLTGNVSLTQCFFDAWLWVWTQPKNTINSSHPPVEYSLNIIIMTIIIVNIKSTFQAKSTKCYSELEK